MRVLLLQRPPDALNPARRRLCARVAPFLLCQLSAFPRAERCPKSIRARQVGSNGKMLHKLLFGLLAACLAGALGAGLLSITPTPWRLLTASKSSSVFCSSASSAGIKSALPTRTCRRGHCRHVPPPQRGHRDRLDGPGAADKNRKQTDPHDGVIRLQRLGKSAPWEEIVSWNLGLSSRSWHRPFAISSHRAIVQNSTICAALGRLPRAARAAKARRKRSRARVC